MIDKMISILEMQEITGGVPARPTIIEMFRADKSMKAKKYGGEWHVPKSSVYRKLKMTGDFDDVVPNKMLRESEFADLAGVVPQTVRKMRNKQEMVLDGEPIGCKLGREWRVSYNQAAEWLGLHVNLDITKAEVETMPVIVQEESEVVGMT